MAGQESPIDGGGAAAPGAEAGPHDAVFRVEAEPGAGPRRAAPMPDSDAGSGEPPRPREPDPDGDAREELAEEFVDARLAEWAVDGNTPAKLAKFFGGDLAAANEAAVALASAESEGAVETALAAVVAGGWPTLDDCIPAGTILSEVDEAFVETSDVPREIPLFAALHYVSALLLQKGSGIATRGGRKRPDLWTVILAPSGAGKTFGLNEIRRAFGGDEVDMFPDARTDRKFVENLSQHNLGMWARDEFAQLLAEMGKGGRMAQTREHLLMCGEGGVVEHGTMSSSVRVENAGLTIFGATVVDTFKRHLGYESIVDGLAQRFGFVFAERDPDRPKMADYTFREEWGSRIGKSWRALRARSDPSRTCFLPPPAAAAYQRAFEILLARAELVGVDEGYSRRLAARAQKYALVYHFILGKQSPLIDAEDLSYGMRIAALHLRDTRRLLDMFASEGAPASPESQREQLLAAVSACLARARDNNAAPVDARKLLQLVKKVKGGELARDLMREAVEADPSLAPFANIAPPKPGAIKSGAPAERIQN